MGMIRGLGWGLGWAWTAALVCFALGVLGLAAAMAVPSLAPPPPGVAGLCDRLPSLLQPSLLQPSKLQTGACTVALLAAALALLSGTRKPPQAADADPAARPPRDLAAELAAVLDAGQATLAHTRATFETALDGAVRTGARLTAAALEAERRLGTTVSRIQEGTAGMPAPTAPAPTAPAAAGSAAVDGMVIEIMRHAAETARRASDQLDRVEQTLPDLLGSVVRAAAAADGGIAAATERLEATVTALGQGADAFAALPQTAEQMTRAAADMAQSNADLAGLRQGLALAGTRLDATADALARSGEALAVLPGAAGRIEAATTGLAQTADALAVLPDAAGRIAAAIMHLAQTADTLACSGEALAALPGAAGRIEAAMAGLAQVSDALAYGGAMLSALPDSAGRIAAATAELAGLHDAAGRIAATAAGLAQAVGMSAATTDRLAAAAHDLAGTRDSFAALLPVPAQLHAAGAQLDAATRRAEAQTDTGMARLGAAIAQAESTVATLAETLAAGDLSAAGARLHHAADRIEADTDAVDRRLAETTFQLDALHAAAEAVGASTSLLDRAAARADVQARQFDAALGRTREAIEAVRAAVEGLAQADGLHGAPASGSVAGMLLADLAGSERPAELTSALNRIGGVETEVGRLLREAESLAERAVHDGPALPGAVTRRAPALLGSLDQTMRQLQSVSTALALACDGRR